MTRLVAAVDLGGTNIRVGLVSEDGAVSGRRDCSTPDHGDQVVEAIGELLQTVIGASQFRPEAVGIGSPGLVDAESGTVVIAPNIAAFRNRAISGPVSQRLGIDVFLENDASAAAIGEHRFGAGRGARHLLHATLGTGIGGGIVIDGRLYRGARGFAGEIGHMVIDPSGPRCACGSRGCLEAIVSGVAFAARARKLLEAGGHPALRDAAGDGEPSAGDLFAAAIAGDRQSEAEIRNGGHTLGLALGGLANVLNPHMITLSGGLLNMGDMLLAPLREALYSIAYGPASGTELAATTLNDDAGLLGAAAVAFDRLGVASGA